MKDTLQKLLAYLLSFMMLFSSLPITAIAEGIAALPGDDTGLPVADTDSLDAPQEPEEPIEGGVSTLLGDGSVVVDVAPGAQPFANVGIMPMASDDPIKVVAYVVKPGEKTSNDNLGNFVYQDFTGDSGAEYGNGLRYWIRVKNTSEEPIEITITSTLTIDDKEPLTGGAALLKTGTRPSNRWPDGSEPGTAYDVSKWGSNEAPKTLTLDPGEEVNARSNSDYTVSFTDERTHSIVYDVVVTYSYNDHEYTASDRRTVESTGVGFSVVKSYSVNDTKYRTSNDEIVFSSELEKHIVYKVTITNSSVNTLKFTYSDTFKVNNVTNPTYAELELSASESVGASIEGGVLTIESDGLAVFVSKNTYTPNPADADSSTWPQKDEKISNEITVTRQDTGKTVTSSIVLTVVTDPPKERWFGYSMAIKGADFPGKQPTGEFRDGPKDNKHETDPNLQRAEYTIGGITMIENGTTSGAGANKYLHYGPVAIDEQVTICSIPPEVEGDTSYKFLVWYDKNADTFYSPGDTLFKDSRSQHTVDALWAHMDAKDVSKIYDGIKDKVSVSKLTLEGELNLDKYDVDKVIKQFLGDTTFKYVIKDAQGNEIESGSLTSLADLPGKTDVGVYHYEITATLTMPNNDSTDITAKATLTILPRPVIIEVNSSTHGRITGTKWKVSDDPLKDFTGEYTIYDDSSAYFENGSLKADVLDAVLKKVGISELPSGITYGSEHVYLHESDAISNANALTVTYTDTKTENPEAASNDGQEKAGVYNVTVDSDEIELSPGTKNNYAFVVIPGKLTIIEPEWKVTKGISAVTHTTNCPNTQKDNNHVHVNDTVTYTVTVQNTGEATVTQPLVDMLTVTVDGVSTTEELTLSLVGTDAGVTFTDGVLTLPVGKTATFKVNYSVGQYVKKLYNMVVVDESYEKDSGDSPEDQDIDENHYAEVETNIEDNNALHVTKTSSVACPVPVPEKGHDGGSHDTTTGGKNIAHVDDIITYTVTIENTGNTTLKNVVVDDSLVDFETSDDYRISAQKGAESVAAPVVTVKDDGTLLLDAIGVGVTVTITYTYEVKETDDQIVNIATVTPEGVEPEKGTDTTEVKGAPKWKVQKNSALECPAGSSHGAHEKDENGKDIAHVDDKVIYTITVQNLGNTDLTLNLTDTFMVDGVEAAPLSLALQNSGDGVQLNKTTLTLPKGKTATLKAEYTVEKDDNALYNVIKAFAPDNSEDTDPDHQDDEENTVEAYDNWGITKSVNVTCPDPLPAKGHNGGKHDPDDDGNTIAHVGDTLTYTITVTNTGNTDLEGLTLADDFTLTSSIAGASPVKLVIVYASGEKVGQTYEEGDQFGLKKGATISFTATYTVQQYDKLLTNIATAAKGDKSVPSEQVKTPVEDTPAIDVEKSVSKIVTAEQETIDNPAEIAAYKVHVGDVVTYTITVTNTGNVALTDVNVTDVFEGKELTILSDVNGTIGTLQPGEFRTLTVAYTITQDDINLSETTKHHRLTNIVKVTGKYNGTEVSDTDDAVITANYERSFSAEKKDPAQYDEHGALKTDFPGYKVGETVYFDITVTNTGKITLNNVTVEEMPGVTILDTEEKNSDGETLYTVKTITKSDGTSVMVATIAAIHPGENAIVKASYVVQKKDIGKSKLENVAIVTDAEDPSVPDDPENPENVQEVTETIPRKAWTVEKTVTEGLVDVTEQGDGIALPGSKLTYQIKIENIGDTPIDKLVLTDKLDGVSFDFSDGANLKLSPNSFTLAKENGVWTLSGNLAAGKSVIIEYQYTVSVSTEAMQITNAVTVSDGNENPDLPPPSSEVTKKIGHWSVEKSLTLVDGAAITGQTKVKAGNMLTYTITVTNTGEADLKNLEIGDKLLVYTNKANEMGTDASKLAISADSKNVADQYGIELNGTTLTLLPKGITLYLTYTYEVQAADKHLTNVATVSKDRNPDEQDNPNNPNDPNGPHTETSEKVDTIIYTDIVVTKAWKDGDGVMSADLIELLTDAITAELYKSVNGGEAQYQTGNDQTLNKDDDWTATFADLPLSDNTGDNLYTYTVKEKNVSEDGYITVKGHVFKVEISNGTNNAYSFTITNTLQNDKNPNAPAKDATALKPDGKTETNDEKVQIGDKIEYTITRTSHLSVKSTATFTDTLPKGLTYEPGSAALTIKIGETVLKQVKPFANPTISGQTLTWTVEDVPPMATVTITYQTLVTAAAINREVPKLDNSVEISFNNDANGGFDPATSTVPIKQPKLAIEKTADVTAAKPGSDIIYTLTVTNSGEGKAVDVIVVDTLPAEVVLDVTSYNPSSANVSYDAKTGKITWKIQEIAAGNPATTVTLSFKVTLKPVDKQNGFLMNGDEYVKSILNAAAITDGMPKDEKGKPIDPDPEDGDDPYTDSERTDVADLTIDKAAAYQGKTIVDSDYCDEYDPGSIITYTITVENVGNITLTDVVITDEKFIEAVRDEEENVIFTVTDADGKAVAYGYNGTDTITIEELPVGAAITITYRYEIKKEDLLSPNKLVNTANAKGKYDPDGDGPMTPTDTNEHEDKVQYPADPRPELVIEKSAEGMTGTDESGQPMALIGDVLIYTITVANEGNVDLENVRVTDDMFADGKAEQESIRLTIDGEEAEFTWADKTLVIDKLPYQSAAVITYTYTVVESDILVGVIPNTATAISDDPRKESSKEGSYDPLEEVTDDEEVPTVKMHSELILIKEEVSTPDEPGYEEGDIITFKITVWNDGNVARKHIEITEDLHGAYFVEGDGYQLKEGDNTVAIIDVLNPDEKVELYAEYMVTQEDLIHRVVWNVVMASQPGSTPAPDPDHSNPPTPVPTPGPGETATPLPTANAKVTPALPHGNLVVDKKAIGVLNEKTGEYETKPEGYALGDVIRYAITVWNEGNVDVYDVIITDVLEGAYFVEGDGYSLNKDGNAVIPMLERHGSKESKSVTVYAEYKVTEADILNGTVHNDAMANGTANTPTPTPGPNGETPAPTATLEPGTTPVPTVPVTPGDDDDDNDTEDKNPSLAVIKTVVSEPADAEGYALGEEIQYSITVTNTGNLTLTDVEVVDEKTGDTWTIPSLAPGESKTFETTYTVTEADVLAGSVLNVATAKGKSPDPENPEVPADPSEVETDTAEKEPHLTVLKLITNKPADNEGYALGEEIQYSITATNDGNLTLTDVEVVDEKTGDKWTIPSLAPGESKTFETTYTVTEADILAGSVLNVATAKGKSPDPENPEVPADRSEVETDTAKKNPHLTILKLITNKPADNEGYAVGEEIQYSITVTNDGNLPLTDVEVVDEKTGDKWTIPSLAPGESKTFEASYVVTEADVLAGSVMNVATAKGKSSDPETPEVPADPSEVETDTVEREPHLMLTKIVTNQPADSEGYALGETVAYQITVTNNGNLTITDIVVTDKLTGDQWKIASLAPGESKNFETTYTVTEADVIAGSVLNVATAKGKSPDPENPDVPTEPGEVEVPTDSSRSHLKLEKKAVNVPASGKYRLGDTIVYQITVTNDGNLTLTDVVVKDRLTGDTWTVPILEPGQSETFTTKYVVTAADVKAGSVLNVATAKGNSPDPNEPEGPFDSSTVKNLTESSGKPTYELTKTATNIPDRGYYLKGEQVEFTVKVKNTGNVEIISFVLTDQLEGTTVVPGAGYSVKSEREALITRLAPGASVNVHLIYTIKDVDVKRGSVRNVVTGIGAAPDGTPAEGNVAEVTVPTDDTVYTVVVHYYYLSDGSTAAPDQSMTGLHPGEFYEFFSPDIEGFWTLTEIVSGTMPAHNVEITVFYIGTDIMRPDDVVEEDGMVHPTLVVVNEYGTPLSVGGSTRNVGDCFE